ncbi:uncharacterized protein LOC104906086 [Beta vulgaris subsp. vulgaris]|uniref:uncharacterized protein LOC104906086 n=1 Tax=Beta vulgaris subsp. vulgaris TaxID=3555 RepID=UPI002036E451|nr:uncharacterized protein LOC104906086 [Beta vulgaris subsp. vulgaris]
MLLKIFSLFCSINLASSSMRNSYLIFGTNESLGVIFQGLWLIVMGFMLWTPYLAPKGCSMKRGEYGRNVIKCDDHGSLHRGKALVNILFSWFLIGMMVFGVGSYLVVNKVYGVNEFMDDDEEELTCQMEDTQRFICRNRVSSIDLEE